MQKIYSVSSVALAILDTSPRRLLVTVIGQVVSSGWNDPQLIAHSRVEPPADGYLEFDFVADPPREEARAAFFPIVAHFVWKGDPYSLKGVRVHASSNRIEEALGAAGIVPAVGPGEDVEQSSVAKPLPLGLPDSAFGPPQSESAPAPEKPGVLLGGTLRRDQAIRGEGSGLFLYNVLVEVDLADAATAEEFIDEQVVTEGEFEIRQFPRRGGAWIFNVRDIRGPRG